MSTTNINHGACGHSLADHYLLGGRDGSSARFCRCCATWLLTSPDGGGHGVGLASYQQAVEEVARNRPDWKGAAYLYDLAGHAPEVAEP